MRDTLHFSLTRDADPLVASLKNIVESCFVFKLFLNVFVWTQENKSFNKESPCIEAKELYKTLIRGFLAMLQTKSKSHSFFMKSEVQH
jgi:hypothetical protein